MPSLVLTPSDFPHAGRIWTHSILSLPTEASLCSNSHKLEGCTLSSLPPYAYIPSRMIYLFFVRDDPRHFDAFFGNFLPGLFARFLGVQTPMPYCQRLVLHIPVTPLEARSPSSPSVSQPSFLYPSGFPWLPPKAGLDLVSLQFLHAPLSSSKTLQSEPRYLDS